MKSRYEILMLTVPDINQDDAKKVESTLSEVVTKGQGEVLSYERWGKYQLAYPIKKHDYGIYYLMRFELPQKSEVLTEIKTMFAIRFGDQVIRFMINTLDTKAPLTYQRPRSLEEAPPAREGVSQGRERRPFGQRDRNGESEAAERDFSA